jgi:hypothetical protein
VPVVAPAAAIVPLVPALAPAAVVVPEPLEVPTKLPVVAPVALPVLAVEPLPQATEAVLTSARRSKQRRSIFAPHGPYAGLTTNTTAPQSLATNR